MHFIRRAAFRAAASPSTSVVSKSSSPSFLAQSKVQSAISPSVFRRFASDNANSESRPVAAADAEEHGTIRSAIDSAAESTSTYTKDAEESLAQSTEPAQETFGGDRGAEPTSGLASGFPRAPRQNRYNDDRRDNYTTRSNNPRSNNPRVLTPTSGIYVGNLLFDVTAKDLEREFEQFGPIKSTIIATDARGLSKGFGYVEFETIEAANAAIVAKNQTVLEGRRLIVNYMARTVREVRENPPSKTLFIGNLAFEMSDADLNKLFRDIRNVIDVRVAIDRRTGQPRGFAHADFVDVESATKGREALMGREIYGRKLRVDFSTGGTKDRVRTGPRNGGQNGGQTEGGF